MWELLVFLQLCWYVITIVYHAIYSFELVREPTAEASVALLELGARCVW
jgi:hypothetical protein